MSNAESTVPDHYGGANLMARIDAGLEAAGIDPNNLSPGDLAPVDEFHTGGRVATEYLLSKMALPGDDRMLDIGCGIGGAARLVAAQTGCRVTGIDFTPEFIDTARTLTERTGQADHAGFEVASALDMPFEDASFDAAITIHVVMNIADREALYKEIARVLKPGAIFGSFDVTRKRDGDLSYPVPWANSAQYSHLRTIEETRALLASAGFDVTEVEDRTDFALDFFRQRNAAAGGGPPPLGVHLLLGPSAPERFKNIFGNLEIGLIAPVQMIAVRSGG